MARAIIYRFRLSTGNFIRDRNRFAPIPHGLIPFGGRKSSKSYARWSIALHSVWPQIFELQETAVNDGRLKKASPIEKVKNQRRWSVFHAWFVSYSFTNLTQVHLFGTIEARAPDRKCSSRGDLFFFSCGVNPPPLTGSVQIQWRKWLKPVRGQTASRRSLKRSRRSPWPEKCSVVKSRTGIMWQSSKCQVLVASSRSHDIPHPGIPTSTWHSWEFKVPHSSSRSTTTLSVSLRISLWSFFLYYFDGSLLFPIAFKERKAWAKERNCASNISKRRSYYFFNFTLFVS